MSIALVMGAHATRHRSDGAATSAAESKSTSPFSFPSTRLMPTLTVAPGLT